jgi:hypothetical protein
MAAGEPVTVERLERALVTMAYIVIRHGPAAAPLLDRIEQEIATLRSRQAPVDRARRLLEAYTVNGGSKAIRSIQSRFCSSDGPTP